MKCNDGYIVLGMLNKCNTLLDIYAGTLEIADIGKLESERLKE
jgi:hypothetical protein